ncbi:MAG: hypothetical protein KAR56_00730 [Thermoplasmata archaeon]|nr:hypothetical protein [Thermoplasmata archaeon]
MVSDAFLKSDEIKVRIVEHLNDRKWHSYYDLQRVLGINYDSLKQHLRFLEIIDLVELSIIKPQDSHSGKGSYKAKIADKGIEWLKLLATIQ